MSLHAPLKSSPVDRDGTGESVTARVDKTSIHGLLFDISSKNVNV